MHAARRSFSFILNRVRRVCRRPSTLSSLSTRTCLGTCPFTRPAAVSMVPACACGDGDESRAGTHCTLCVPLQRTLAPLAIVPRPYEEPRWQSTRRDGMQSAERKCVPALRMPPPPDRHKHAYTRGRVAGTKRGSVSCTDGHASHTHRILRLHLGNRLTPRQQQDHGTQ